MAFDLARRFAGGAAEERGAHVRLQIVPGMRFLVIDFGVYAMSGSISAFVLGIRYAIFRSSTRH
eukprot:3939300-Rhodomonas_salina.1